MTCRIGRSSSNALVTHLHAPAGLVRVVEIDGCGSMPVGFDQLKCPNCSIAVRPISASNHSEHFLQRVYQCDDCLGMVRFISKQHP